jgi:hypothetical protein
MRKLFVSLVAIALLLFGNLYVSAQEPAKPDYSWVNGKWAGLEEDGGNLTMDLKLVKNTEVQGLGLIPLGGRRSIQPTVFGTVDGKQVLLELKYPRRTANYQFIFNEGVLECSTQAGFKTTFRKSN